MEVLTSIIDALTLVNNILDLEWIGVRDFASESCVWAYECPGFEDLEEYVWIEIGKSGKIEIFEGVAEASKRKPTRTVKRVQPLSTIEEVDETEQEEPVVPNHIIM